MRFLRLYFLALMLPACANLTQYQPTGLLEIPEVADTDPGGSLDIGMIPTIEYNATSDPSHRTFAFDPHAAVGTAHFARARFPLDEDLELGAGIYSTAGIFGSFKYKFWGPKSSRAKSGDTSLAFITLANISANSVRTGNGKGESSGGYPWEAKVSGNQAGGSLLFGWRWKDDLLFYGGPYGSYANVQADVNQATSTEDGSAGGDYRLVDYIFRYGPVLGTMLSNGKYSFQLEAAFLLTKVGQPAIKVDPAMSISLVLRHDDSRPEPEKYY